MKKIIKLALLPAVIFSIQGSYTMETFYATSIMKDQEFRQEYLKVEKKRKK